PTAHVMSTRGALAEPTPGMDMVPGLAGDGALLDGVRAPGPRRVVLGSMVTTLIRDLHNGVRVPGPVPAAVVPELKVQVRASGGGRILHARPGNPYPIVEQVRPHLGIGRKIRLQDLYCELP